MRFEDCFWGSDFNSTAGFDTLCKRMKDGKQMCQEFEDFIKLRADAEERYGKSLVRLAGTGVSMIEIGSLRESWDVIRQETENCGKAHIDFAQQLMDQIEKVAQEFREEQKNQRKPVEETVKKVQRNKRMCFDNNLKQKKLYEQRCREHDSCLEQLKRSASSQGKDEEKRILLVKRRAPEKNRQKFSKSKTARENADANYQSTVKLLEESRKEWEREMEICCNTFEKCESERISFLRNYMWIYANLGSSNCLKTDEHYEEMRKSLEHCDVEADIHFFVSKKQTGSERPAPILYENFYTVQSNQKSPQVPSAPPPRAAPRPGLPSLPPTPGQQNNVKHFDEEEDPTYSTVHETVRQRSKPVSIQKMVRAEFDYTAQGDEELTFREGDMIKFIRAEDDTWWYGEMNGKRGMFPRDFVSPPK